MEIHYTGTPVKTDKRPKTYNNKSTLGLANHNIKPFLAQVQLIV